MSNLGLKLPRTAKVTTIDGITQLRLMSESYITPEVC